VGEATPTEEPVGWERERGGAVWRVKGKGEDEEWARAWLL
jgi:hypothetical protein